MSYGRQLGNIEIDIGINNLVKYGILKQWQEKHDVKVVPTDEFLVFGKAMVRVANYVWQTRDWASRIGYYGEKLVAAHLIWDFVEWKNVFPVSSLIDHNDLEIMAAVLDKLADLDVEEGMAKERTSKFNRGER